MRKYVTLFRIKHYIKNFLIFIPIFFSRKLFCQEKILACFFAFIAFCFASSAIYIFNDIIDAEKDSLHPIKKNRPIASGVISIKKAVICGICCSIFALIFQEGGKNAITLWCIPIYLILNILYSIFLKNKVLWDVVILVSGFLIRVLYGAVVADVAISGWLYLTVIAISFYMAFGKRRNELKETGEETRSVLKYYSYEFLDKNMYMCMCMANVFYSLWAMDSGRRMLLTVPIILILSIRYSFVIECKQSRGDPIEVILSDKAILLIVAIYIICICFFVYIV